MKTRIVIFLLFVFSINPVCSQRKEWGISLTKNFFIENNEFHSKINNQDIIYWTHTLNSNVYFLKDKVIFERYHTDKETILEEYPIRKKKDSISSYFWSIGFHNNNSAVVVKANDLQNHVILSKDLEAFTYKEITYFNVWEKIDIKFYLPDSGGLKYDIILNPGANPNNIALKYNGIEKVELMKNKNLRIKTKMDEIIDKAPFSYYQSSKEQINSEFNLKQDVLTIDLGEYDNSKKIIIDPWLTSLAGGYYACDIDYDNDNNIYANCTAGVSTEIRKYNSNGILQWTYILPVGGPFGSSISDVTVNRVTQEIYFTSSDIFIPLGEVAIYRFDEFGVQIADHAYSPPEPEEYWRVNYDYCNNQVIIGSGGSNSFFQAARLNEDLVSVTGINMVGATSGNRDVNNLIIDPDGLSCYMLISQSSTPDGLYDNALLKLSLPNLTTTWQVNSNHGFVEFGSTLVPSAGSFNGMACGHQYLYTYDGFTLNQWDKTNGNLINTTMVANVVESSSGIDVDACGNIYVGIDNFVLVFNSSLTQINSIAIPGNCLDLIIGNDNRLYVCGTNFIEEFQISSPLSISQTDDNCNQGLGTATIVCENSNFLDVLWSPGGETTVQATGLSEGWYTVTVSGNTCTDTYSTIDSVYINDVGNGCSFQIGLEDSIICTNDCIDLIVTSVEDLDLVTFVWDNGIVLDNDSVNICPNVTTTYNVIATNVNGDIAMASATVTVVAPPIVNLGNDVTICGGSLTLDAGNVGSTYLWQDNSTNQTLTVTSSGTYSVTVNNGGCTSIDQIDVIVNGPQVDLGPDIITCNPNIILDANNPGSTYLWQDNSTDQTFTVSDTGTYYVDVTDGSGCTLTDTLVVFPVVLELDLGPDFSVCSGSIINLDASNAGSTYLWQDNSSNQTLTVTTGGVYYVDVVDGVCSVSDTVNVIFQNSVASFNVNDTIGCTPLVTVFTDQSILTSSIVSWDWMFGDGMSSSFQNPSHSYSQSGTYSVSLSVTTVNGCVSNILHQVSIELYEQPTANFSFSPSNPLINDNIIFEDLSQNALNWYWSFGDGLHSNIQNPTHTYTTINTYGVNLFVSNGTCVDSVSKSIIIEEELIFYVPNAFTPDGDQVNNLFSPIFTSGFDPYDYHLIIFNRWGEVVFESFNSDVGWDGSYGSQNLVEDGVYAWRLEFGNLNNDSRHLYNGHVVLLK